MTEISSNKDLVHLLEALLFASNSPLSVAQIKQLLNDHQVKSLPLTSKNVQSAITTLIDTYQHRGVNLVNVAGGYRFQTSDKFKALLNDIHADKACKITPAMMETLAIIAYKQPITRSEIEEIRGVAISSYIIKTLTERDWIKVTGQKEVPGRPSLFGTTNAFLAYFGLNTLAQLPEVMPINQSTLLIDDVKETEA